MVYVREIKIIFILLILLGNTSCAIHEDLSPENQGYYDSSQSLHDKWMRSFAQFEQDLAQFEQDHSAWRGSNNIFGVDILNWQVEFDQYQKRENALIEGMNDKQLEICSKYIDAVNEGNKANQVIYRRKLINLMSDDQKVELKKLSLQYENLQTREVELVKRKEMLVAEAKDLDEWRKDIDEWRNDLIQTNAMMSSTSQLQASYANDYSPIIESLKSFQRTLDQQAQSNQQFYQQQQQNMQMNAMTNSLRDISNALRGF